MKKSMKAAIKVVIFASKIVVLDFVYPLSKATILLFSDFDSSLILSKINTLASTAIPIVKTIPAIPGSVKVALIIVKIDNKIIKLKINAMFAKIPNKTQRIKRNSSIPVGLLFGHHES